MLTALLIPLVLAIAVYAAALVAGVVLYAALVMLKSAATGRREVAAADVIPAR